MLCAKDSLPWSLLSNSNPVSDGHQFCVRLFMKLKGSVRSAVLWNAEEEFLEPALLSTDIILIGAGSINKLALARRDLAWRISYSEVMMLLQFAPNS